MAIKLVVRRRRPERFVMVPTHVVAMLATGELTASAFSALVAMMVKPDGWSWSAPDVMAASGLGKDAWQAARRVLVKAGAVVPGRGRVADGRFAGSTFDVDWPEAPAGDADYRGPGFPAPGGMADNPPVSASPGAGKPGSTEPENPAPFFREERRGAPPRSRRSGATRRAPLVELCEADGPNAKIEPAGKAERLPELRPEPVPQAAGGRWSLPAPSVEAKARVRSLVADFIGGDRARCEIASNEASGRAVAAE